MRQPKICSPASGARKGAEVVHPRIKKEPTTEASNSAHHLVTNPLPINNPQQGRPGIVLDFVRPTTLPDFSPNDLMDTAAAPAASSGVDFSTPLTILYHDADLVAVYKPAGWLVHRSAIARHEKRFVLQRLRDQIGQHVWPVHRLDQGACGLLVFALNEESCQQLALAFAEQRVPKHLLGPGARLAAGAG